MHDFYKILGVPRRADTDTIKQAYRKQAMKHHPDKGGDGAYFATVNEAYRVLSDPKSRAEYDARLMATQIGAKLGRAWQSVRQKVQHTPLADALARTDSFFQDKPIPLVIDLALGYTGGHKTVLIDNERVQIDIPKGAHNGQIIQLQNKRFCIYYQTTTWTQVQGLDVYLPIFVAPHIAYFGGMATLDCPTGQISVAIGARTQAGTRLRLQNRGLDNGVRTGDIIASVVIQNPTLTPTQEALFAKFAKSLSK